jgi:hypothetical protein
MPTPPSLLPFFWISLSVLILSLLGCQDKKKLMNKGEVLLEDSTGTYQGEVQNGIPHGKGEKKWKNGVIYKGQWAKGVGHGQGVLISGNKRYNGFFKEGQKHRAGIYHFEDGSKYEGEFEGDLFKPGGKRQGRGIFQYPDGMTYRGFWHDDKPSGYGELLDSKGSHYQGEWYQGLRHGFGIFENKEKQEIQQGRWIQDNLATAEKKQIDGKEALVWPDGLYYLGTHEKELPQGKGTLGLPQGILYEGDWKNGLYHGQGRRYFSDKSYHEGEWFLGMRHGKGIHTQADGTSLSGNWEDNKFIKPQQNPSSSTSEDKKTTENPETPLKKE